MSKEDIAFNEWFHSMRGFQTRCDAFYATFDVHTDNKKMIESMRNWLKAAFCAGCEYRQENSNDGK